MHCELTLLSHHILTLYDCRAWGYVFHCIHKSRHFSKLSQKPGLISRREIVTSNKLSPFFLSPVLTLILVCFWFGFFLKISKQFEFNSMQKLLDKEKLVHSFAESPALCLEISNLPISDSQPFPLPLSSAVGYVNLFWLLP